LEPDSDDEEIMPAPKKVTGSSKKGLKKPKAKSKVVESSEDEPEVTVRKKEKHNSLQNASQDTDIEEIPNPKEDPEEELGKLYIASQIHASHLPRWYLEEKMAKDWTSPIYGFFQPRPEIKVVDGRRCHEFQCAAPLCRGKGLKPRMVRRYLDKGDRNSTSNMHKHAKNCWGEENVSKALNAKGELSIDDVRKSLGQAKLHDGSITASFERKGKGSVTFSTRQHTYTETRLVNTSLVIILKKSLTICVAGLNVSDG
jgi:hypothetical protein